MPITHAEVRMYRMGTGDCFILKFFEDETPKFNMMIDCGTWKGNREKLEPYIHDIKNYVGNHLHVLVVTHEHLDHVSGFNTCKDLFSNNFTVDHVWMGWTENEHNPKVKQWQQDFGNKKKAIALAAEKLADSLSDYEKTVENERSGKHMLGAREAFSVAIGQMNALHNNPLDEEKQYVGGLAGMKFVKETLKKESINYYRPGDIIEQLPELEGIRFYVLGPPELWKEEVKLESGGKDESYERNPKSGKLNESEAFAAAILEHTGDGSSDIVPFDHEYVCPDNDPPSGYLSEEDNWRRIDTEWLQSAGMLALRVNSATNNLSLALAIEFEESGKVMLFPGDAEYGSWKSWHSIPWEVPCKGEDKKKHFTEDLLNRTVFYKVAHHLSNNGTARRLGLEMMTSPDLAAMATLDYAVISPGWTGTMPNQAMLKSLIPKTKGRLMVMNEKDLIYDPISQTTLTQRVEQERKKMNNKEKEDFKNALRVEDLFIQYRVDGRPLHKTE